MVNFYARFYSADVSQCFQFSVREAVDSIKKQKQVAQRSNMVLEYVLSNCSLDQHLPRAFAGRLACRWFRSQSLAFPQAQDRVEPLRNFNLSTRFKHVCPAPLPIPNLSERSSTHTSFRSKAVADGAIGYFLDRWVTTRVAKVSCGLQICSNFDTRNPEHRQRQHLKQKEPSGQVVLGGQFRCFVSKVRL